MGDAHERVSLMRGDEYLARKRVDRVDFVKIDTEGYEREVIEGLRGTLGTCRPVVFLELNHWCLNGFRRTSVPDFLDFLRGIFPVLYAAIDGQRSP